MDAFCSTSVGAHLLRGGAAIALLGAAWLVAPVSILLAALAVLVALALLRGCPLCWVMGLVGTARRTRTQHYKGVGE